VGERPKRKFDNLLLYSDEIKNDWRYPSNTPYAFITWCRTTLPFVDHQCRYVQQDGSRDTANSAACGGYDAEKHFDLQNQGDLEFRDTQQNLTK
jgi:hypothetical protein